jgi:hypothetical protein
VSPLCGDSERSARKICTPILDGLAIMNSHSEFTPNGSQMVLSKVTVAIITLFRTRIWEPFILNIFSGIAVEFGVILECRHCVATANAQPARSARLFWTALQITPVFVPDC